MNALHFGLYFKPVLRRIQNGDADYQGMLLNALILPNAVENTTAA